MKTIVWALLMVSVLCFVVGVLFWNATAAELSAASSLLALVAAMVMETS